MPAGCASAATTRPAGSPTRWRSGWALRSCPDCWSGPARPASSRGCRRRDGGSTCPVRSRSRGPNRCGAAGSWWWTTCSPPARPSTRPARRCARRVRTRSAPRWRGRPDVPSPCSRRRPARVVVGHGSGARTAGAVALDPRHHPAPGCLPGRARRADARGDGDPARGVRVPPDAGRTARRAARRRGSVPGRVHGERDPGDDGPRRRHHDRSQCAHHRARRRRRRARVPLARTSAATRVGDGVVDRRRPGAGGTPVARDRVARAPVGAGRRARDPRRARAAPALHGARGAAVGAGRDRRVSGRVGDRTVPGARASRPAAVRHRSVRTGAGGGVIHLLAEVDLRANQGGTVWHRASALAKLLLALAVLAVAVFAPSWRVLVVAHLLAWILALSSRLPVRLVAAIASYPILFSALFVIARWDGTWQTPVLLVLRPLTASLLAAWLVGTTPYPDLFAPVARVLPRPAGDSLFLTYRALFALLQRADRLWRALRLRGGFAGPARRRLSHAGEGLGVLVVHSFERSRRIYETMHLRGHSGRVCGCRHYAEWTADDVFVLAAGVTFAAACLLVGRTS